MIDEIDQDLMMFYNSNFTCNHLLYYDHYECIFFFKVFQVTLCILTELPEQFYVSMSNMFLNY